MQSQSVSSFESYFSSRFCILSIIFIALLHISTWALLACLASFPRCSDFCFLIFLLSFSSLLPSTLASGESGFTTGSLTTSRPSSLESMESRFAAVQTCWSFVTRGGHTCVSNGFALLYDLRHSLRLAGWCALMMRTERFLDILVDDPLYALKSGFVAWNLFVGNNPWFCSLEGRFQPLVLVLVLWRFPVRPPIQRSRIVHRTGVLFLPPPRLLCNVIAFSLGVLYQEWIKK